MRDVVRPDRVKLQDSPAPFNYSRDSIRQTMAKDAHEMTDLEVRSRILTLAFEGDERLLIAFYRKLQEGVPEGTGIVLRGSVITNKRHEDGAPFDSQGKGTSDLDVTQIGRAHV